MEAVPSPLSYRVVTRECSARDWGCATHGDVAKKHARDRLFRAFQERDLSACFAGSNRMDRSRGMRKGQPRPGPHTLGNLRLKAPAQRAWLWKDTGELLDAESELGDLEIIWMVAKGARRRRSATDLQQSHKALLQDPHDTWLPTDEDYEDLAECHAEAWFERAEEAIRTAATEAQANLDELCIAEIDRISAQVLQEEISAPGSAGVIETYSGRYVLISNRYSDRSVLPLDDAVALASAAYSEDAMIEMVTSSITIGHGYTVDPSTTYCFYSGI